GKKRRTDEGGDAGGGDAGDAGAVQPGGRKPRPKPQPVPEWLKKFRNLKTLWTTVSGQAKIILRLIESKDPKWKFADSEEMRGPLSRQYTMVMNIIDGDSVTAQLMLGDLNQLKEDMGQSFEKKVLKAYADLHNPIEDVSNAIKKLHKHAKIDRDDK
ncbi:unnamed protein product, partial [Prorocentrum cordatum]